MLSLCRCGKFRESGIFGHDLVKFGILMIITGK